MTRPGIADAFLGRYRRETGIDLCIPLPYPLYFFFLTFEMLRKILSTRYNCAGSGSSPACSNTSGMSLTKTRLSAPSLNKLNSLYNRRSSCDDRTTCLIRQREQTSKTLHHVVRSFRHVCRRQICTDDMGKFYWHVKNASKI